MTRRPKSSAAKPLPREAEPRDGLNLHSSRDRLRILLKERERLMAHVQKKKLEMEHASAEAQKAAVATLEKLAPLIARYEALSIEVNQLFDELLAPGRLSMSARKKVARIRRMLEAEGMLECREDPVDQDAYDEESDFDDPFEFHPAKPSAAREVPSAAPRGQDAGHESLRSLFKRLTRAMHPDLATHEPDREQRTEVMKQVTQAYNDGDLARLLELEKAWQQNAAMDADGDDEARCVEVERMINELHAQVKQLNRELRQVKKSAPPPMMVHALDFTIAQSKAELDRFEKVREFVKSFRDGKITLAEFVRGPSMGMPEEFDLEALAMKMIHGRSAKRRTKPSQGARSRSRQA